MRANLERVGLLTTLVWNERSGHLVSGHQRLRIVDDLEGSLTYTIGVAVVDLDDQHERELNVFLNNTWAQGEFDAEKLMALVADGGANAIAEMGWRAEELLLEYGARPELVPHVTTPERQRRVTAQDTLGPHVMLVFRHNDDKAQFLRHVQRPDDTIRMTADEVLTYMRADARWRDPA